jgi:hypothetical protein
MGPLDLGRGDSGGVGRRTYSQNQNFNDVTKSYLTLPTQYGKYLSVFNRLGVNLTFPTQKSQISTCYPYDFTTKKNILRQHLTKPEQHPIYHLW